MSDKSRQAFKKTRKSINMALPIIVGVLLLISLFNQLVDINYLKNFFHQNILWDSFLGAVIGSLAAGSPITSYVIGGELLKIGISLAAVTAFIITWVTVGIIQLPAETIMLGKKFALTRNAVSFVTAIIIAVITWLILGVI